jgi:Rps23 Pro-64 3,4-dihydroxylase Tpa1-like proline 4-hydroxylase
MKLVNDIEFNSYRADWIDAKPFSHIVVDNFLEPEILEKVTSEFPSYFDESWRIYNSPIEVKKLLNHWDKFGPTTYLLFAYLNSREFIKLIEPLVGCTLYADPGLNGGGLHSHTAGGKLNVHLDYNIHPKLQLQRKVNLLLYVSREWLPQWGGELGLWSVNADNDGPSELVKKIEPKPNRAVLFDTTQNSWHGLPDPICCPEEVCRNSMAVYYLCEPPPNASNRGKALFSPYKEQSQIPEIIELIQLRSDTKSARRVYGDGESTH